MKLPPKKFSSAALDLIMQYSWPGNVRQLENVCERMVVFSRDELVDADILPPELKSSKGLVSDKTTETRIPRTKSELKAEKTWKKQGET
jgi:DNA-binding NtrC family response regulator